MFYVSGLVKYDPMRASSYLPLPKELKPQRGCLNVQNNEEKCFVRSILGLLHPLQYWNNQFRVSKYQEYSREFNMSVIQYPVDIKKLANLNTRTTLVLMSMGKKIKKSSRYILPPWPRQGITWIYYISLLVKHHITYW